MNAIRVREFGPPCNMRLETADELRPGPGELLIELRAAGVNPVDTYIRSGSHAVRPALPYTPGFDGAGIVRAGGEGCVRFQPGDRVYLSGALTGTYADYALCSEDRAYHLPDHVTFVQGAAIGIPYVSAYRALFQVGRARAGEVVLVRGGTGAVGLAALQLGRAAGLTMVATAGSSDGRHLAYEHGASLVSDHDGAAVVEHMRGRGPDVILEMRADLNLGHDLRLVGPRGRIVVVGSRGNATITPRDAMIREASVLSIFYFTIPSDDLASIHAALRAALESGVVKPVVRRELPLADAPAAHQALERHSPGKLVLVSEA